MKINRSYKFRIYPNTGQEILFVKTFGCTRFVYNHWLDLKIKQYNKDKTSISYVECAKDMKQLKHTDEFSFLNEVDSISLQQSLRHLDTAFQNFFKIPKTGFPKFKSKKNNKLSYSTECVNGNISVSKNHIKLPKVGLVKIKQHRNIPSDYRLKAATISKTPSGKYYVSILFEYEKQIQRADIHNSIGLDFSMKELYIDSYGNEPQYPHYYRKAEKKDKARAKETFSYAKRVKEP